MNILNLTHQETGDVHHVNMDGLDAMKGFEGGAALFMKSGQRLNVRETPKAILDSLRQLRAAYAFAAPYGQKPDNRAIYEAIDEARRKCDVLTTDLLRHGVDREVFFDKIVEIMTCLGRIERA